ncbi:ATP-binding protein [Streptomyces sp. NPDC051776]|uniref:ATP-binding protein n=1 Tax=Streptomyces sp. NPDC051776 TaxID=3155414 RepID=UPI00341B1D9C
MASFHDALQLADRGDIAVVDCRNAFELPALRTSVAEARRQVVTLLHDWGADGETAEGAELVVSELVTNAICHTDSDTIGCELRVTGALLRVDVADEGWSTTAPLAHPGPVDLDGEGGRGLLLVDALSETWGVLAAVGGHGHVVWAELPYAQGPAGPADCF